MYMKNSNSLRILKNTMALYFRMIFLTVISLFTVRIVLIILGVEDYGLYNLVTGFVGILSFLSSTLMIAFQRYFAVYLATNDWENLNRFFSVSWLINICFIGIVFILAETVGLWVLKTQLIIPESRLNATIFAYEFSVITFLLGILISPYQALLVADENLSIYAGISIFEGICKMAVAYALLIVQGDKLILYSFLFFMTSFFSYFGFFLYCKSQYPLLKHSFYRDKRMFWDIYSFLNWNLIGALAFVLKYQGVNVVLNLFFGRTVNAARGLALQIHNVILSFAQNFMKAMEPRIIKTYTASPDEKVFDLLYTTSKVSYYLLFVVTFPIIIHCEFILNLWLVKPPDYVVIFIRLLLIDALIMNITDPLFAVVSATGNLKMFQILVGSISLINVPLSYIVLFYWDNPCIPFFISIILTLLMTGARLYSLQRITSFSAMDFCKFVLVPISVVSGLSIISGYIICDAANNIYQLFVYGGLNICFIAFFTFVFGLNYHEKQIILQIVQQIKLKFKGVGKHG